jgi:cytochrome c2
MTGLSSGRWWFVALAATTFGGLTTGAHAADTTEIAKAKYLWSQSPHGKLLERILPPAVEPHELPEPQSDGARLTARYCVQCHYLPNPQMHTAAKWPSTVERMVWRMQGKGNLGELMTEMMAHVRAPTMQEVATLTRYLQKHGQKEINPAHPALRTAAGQMYSLACSQCHALPDPQRHTARRWPAVVERMKGHMSWVNVVVGASEMRTVPELNTAEIVRFLQRHARAESKTR